METIQISVDAEIPADPKGLALLFWNMSDQQQADFFHELGLLAKANEEENPGGYGMCEMQWCYMANAIKKRSPIARDMYMALSVFAFDYWPQKLSLTEAQP